MQTEPHDTTQEQPQPTSDTMNLDWELRHKNPERLASWEGILRHRRAKMTWNDTKSTRLTAPQWPPREVLEHAQQHGRNQGTPLKPNT